MKSLEQRWDSSSSFWLLGLVACWLWQGAFASYDDYGARDLDDDEVALGSNTNTSRNAWTRGGGGGEDESLEAAVISFFFLLCALAVSLFGTGLAYFSCLEDGLMRRYAQEGVKLHANVLTADFTRTIRPPSSSSSATAAAADADHEEYLAIIDYRLQDRDSDPNDHTCLVLRKQVKALGSDFCRAQQALSPTTQDPNHIVKIEFPNDDDYDNGSCPVVSPAQSNNSTNNKDTTRNNINNNNSGISAIFHPIVSPASSSSCLLPPSSLQLIVLVLPDFKHSALPQPQVERACRWWSYRLPTAATVLCAFLLVWLCLFLGLSETLPRQHDDPQQQGGEEGLKENLRLLLFMSGIALMACLGTALAITHFCLSGIMQQLLRSEYLDGGDMVVQSSPIGGGDSYSISSGDDVYLMLS